MLKTCRLPALCMVILLLPSLLLGQSTNAVITGQVTDPSKALIPQARVTAINNNTNVRYEGMTNDVGTFLITSIPPGEYRIQVEKLGFKTIVKPDVTLHVQDTIELNFEMGLGSASETITVEGGAPLVNTESAALSTVVDRQFVANIPLNGRSFQSLIALTPGTTAVPGGSPGVRGEFSVNGQRTETNYFTVDGVSANTGVGPTGGVAYGNGGTPGQTVLGTTQSMLSVDALQEFRINSSTYSAEFGRTPGAQISMLSRSGTNEWHGSAYDYLRNDALDANNWFNNRSNLRKQAERQNDFGGTLGGPVIIPGFYNGRNKTFFFFSYEGLRLVVPAAAGTTLVPDMSLRQNSPAVLQPILNSFPRPNGPGQANNLAQFTYGYSAPSKVDAISVRLDHSFGNRLNVFGRFSSSPSDSTTRSLATLTSNVFDARALTLGATTVLSPRLNNEFRLNFTWHNTSSAARLDSFGGAQPASMNQLFSSPPPPGYQFGLVMNWGGPTLLLYAFEMKQRQFNLTDSFNTVLGNHILKFGVDLRELSTDQYANQLANIYYYFTPAEILQNTPRLTTALTNGTIAPRAIFWNYSAFVQDEWKVTDRLHLSVGLRWDVNPPPTNGNGPLPYTLDQVSNLATAKLAPLGTPLWKTDYRGFGPRLGVAYQIRQRSGYETLVRAGAGLFYDTGNALGAYGLSGGVGLGSQVIFSNASFPFTPAQNTLPTPSNAAPYTGHVTAFDPHLRLPYTIQWNLAVEQGLGRSQKLTVSYVGAGARKLIYGALVNPASVNPNFSRGLGAHINMNGSTSSYNALQVQFQRRLSRGLQVLASYSWAHSIDSLSSNYAAYAVPLRASSDFDVRHNFAAALTYEIPGDYTNPIAKALMKHWAIDARVAGRSALPFSITSGSLILVVGTTQAYARPNIVAGAPIYLNDPTAPGGRVVNFNAFTSPPAGQDGNAPRNFLRGFDAWQTDFAVRREFPLRERVKLQFRAEAFNLFNRPNFGAINNSLTSGAALFGRASGTLNKQLGGMSSLYQMGGPRSMQLALKLIF